MIFGWCYRAGKPRKERAARAKKAAAHGPILDLKKIIVAEAALPDMTEALAFPNRVQQLCKRRKHKALPGT